MEAKISIRLTTDAFDPDAAIAAFAAERSREDGALASFVGYCRTVSKDGDAVTQLELAHYPGFTEAEIARLAETVKQRHGISGLHIIHRVGAIAAGEAIVLVAARSVHRHAAFAAVAELMDLLKTDAPLWKQEIGASGSRWIEPTDTDRARRRAHEGNDHD